MTRNLCSKCYAVTRSEAVMLTALPEIQTEPQTSFVTLPQESYVNGAWQTDPNGRYMQIIIRQRGSSAGRAILHTAGVSVPGVGGLRRACRVNRRRWWEGEDEAKPADTPDAPDAAPVAAAEPADP